MMIVGRLCCCRGHYCGLRPFLALENFFRTSPENAMPAEGWRL